MSLMMSGRSVKNWLIEVASGGESVLVFNRHKRSGEEQWMSLEGSFSVDSVTNPGRPRIVNLKQMERSFDDDKLYKVSGAW